MTIYQLISVDNTSKEVSRISSLFVLSHSVFVLEIKDISNGAPFACHPLFLFSFHCPIYGRATPDGKWKGSPSHLKWHRCVSSASLTIATGAARCHIKDMSLLQDASREP
jgi:hypothetical protein